MSSAEEFLLLLIGLGSALVAALLWLVLPLVSWLRTSRLTRELAEVKARLSALEARQQAAPPLRDVAAPAPVTPPAAAAPDAAPPTPPASATETRTDGQTYGPTEPQTHGPTDPQTYGPTEPQTYRPADLEEAIGGRLMLWVGAIVLVLGVAFFLKYAFDNEWINETMRVALGIAAGLGLIVAGQRFSGRGYRAYGQMLAGGGIAVLFLSVYAAFSFYALIGRTTTFLLLVMLTAGAAVLADRQRAFGLAIMAVGGGFMTPFLVGGGQDAQLTLFSYDALLVVGTLYLANRQDWPGLNALSFVLTVFTICAWTVEYFTPAKWLRTELFLTLFCVLFLLILRAQLARHGWRHLASFLLAAGPLLYHLASLALLEPHGVAVWVYLIAATMAAVGLAARADASAGWRWAAFAAVILPMLAWIDSHQSSRWLTANLVTAVAIFALHLLAQLDRIFRHQRMLEWGDHLLQHLNGYALIAALYMSVEDVWLSIAPTLCVAVGVAHGAVTARLWGSDRRAALHALAVAIGALTVALAVQLDGPWLTVALGVEGALVIVLGLHLGERAFRLGGAGVMAAAVFRYMGLTLPDRPAVFHPIAHEAFVIGLLLAALLYWVAWYARRIERAGAARAFSGTTIAVVVASFLVVVACSAHNDAYWTLEGDNSADARFASSLALSAIWTVLASAFIGVGLVRDFAPLRYLSMALFGLTVLKVFLVDLSSLGGIYRILGFIGVGLVLLAVSFLYQRGRGRRPPATEA
jgi:uncharacterized membrane protein